VAKLGRKRRNFAADFATDAPMLTGYVRVSTDDFVPMWVFCSAATQTPTLSGQNARINVTAVRTDGSPNFTAEMTGSRASMTGPMMSGMSRQPVRSCTLVLSAV